MSTPRPCDLCGQTDPARFRIFYDGHIKVFKCRDCGFVGQYPGPGKNTIVESYEESHFDDPISRGARWNHEDLAAYHADTVSRIKHETPGGRLLDIGCGDGHLLSHCIAAGFDAEGAEHCSARAEHAESATGAPIHRGAYSKELFEESTFDVITMTQVLEHIPKPKEALAAMRHHLKPGGLLVLEVPSLNAPHVLLYRATRIKWFAEKKRGVWYQHTGYYSPATMRRMCEESGFNTLYTHTGRWGLKYQGLIGAIGKVLDPVFAATGVGGILYVGRSTKQ